MHIRSRTAGLLLLLAAAAAARRGPRRFSAASVPVQAARRTCKAARFGDRASGGRDMTLKKKLAAALAAAGLAVGLSLAGTGTARATDFPTPGQWAEIFNPYLHAKGNTLCFDDPNGSTSFGTQVQLYRCHGYASNGAPQRWVFVQPDDSNGNPITEGGNNVYELYNLAAGRCLAVTGTSVGHPLIMGSCITSSTSIAWWELRPTTPASHDFQLALWLFDDWCIGADDFRDNSPTRLLLFGCSPTDTSQLWNLG
jgi:hypothetical protein